MLSRTGLRLLAPIACCSCLVLLECTGTQAPVSPIDIVPAGSAFVLVADWTVTRTDACLRKTANADEIERQLAGIGLAGTCLSEAAVFALAADPGNSEAIVASGSFRPRAVLQSLREQGWTPLTYHRYRVARSPSGEEYAAAIGPNVIALGKEAGVAAVLDVARGAAEPFTKQEPYDRMVVRYRREGQPVYAVVVVPQEAQDMGQAALSLSAFGCGLLGVDAVGSVLSTIPSTHAIGVCMAPAKGIYRSEIGMVLSDEKAASMITGSIGLLKCLTWILSGGREGRETLAQADKLSSTRDREIVYIAVMMTAEEVLR